MQVMDLNATSALYLKALIYGKPGTGKTTLGATAPKPLILASERQALVHIRQAQARTGTPIVGALHMQSLQDYGNVLRTLRLATQDPEQKKLPFEIKNESGKVLFSSPTWPESIVIDSITDACKLIDADIMRRSPAKEGRDGLPVVSERYWSVLRDNAEKLFRGFRDVDFHVIFIALEDDRTTGEGDEAERSVGPSLPMRALPSALAAAVNVVGVMTRLIKPATAPKDGSTERGEADIRYVVRTVGPQWFLLKPYRPLRDVEEPNFSSWVARIAGTIAEQVHETVKTALADGAFEEASSVSTKSGTVLSGHDVEPNGEVLSGHDVEPEAVKPVTRQRRLRVAPTTTTDKPAES
jgi:hypothetical protein